ncbi:GIY-YIG nuclease family protein [Pallidibacillus pasinlerensis]|uniref:GIY-YIG nuclease family protein n=1 Tax=Pallidibacillus pasinlerensis TaxID=2703818 RepID=A0ABX0A5L2_9BACI|nr:GIY-YIG nuclease family protein [Pallidibacillus pasinlerensis]NCU18671.1 GIY-YIG nuclease family protein [Pallidibacillus pasinlerensis]
MEKNEHYFYVLECADGSFYGGYARDVQKRLAVHNSGKGAKYTRSRLPVKLIYSETYETKSEAMRAEYKFKKLTRKEKEVFLREFWSSEHSKKFPE